MKYLDVRLMVDYDCDPEMLEAALDAAVDVLQASPGVSNVYYSYDNPRL
jgi:hypothetical protein